jgi:DNA-binding MarR family transcriptional regulator
MAEQTNLGQLLLRAFRWFDESLIAALHAAGWPELTRAHSLVFAQLDSGGTRTAEIARRAGISRQAVHQTVQELQRLGLVTLVRDPTNRSAKLVVPTDRGQASIQVAKTTLAKLEDELAQRLGGQRVQALRQALEADWGPTIDGSPGSMRPSHRRSGDDELAV